MKRRSLLPLLAGVLISLALHAVMLAGTWLDVSRESITTEVLEARLAPARAPPPEATPPAPPPRPHRTVRPRKPPVQHSRPEVLALRPTPESTMPALSLPAPVEEEPTPTDTATPAAETEAPAPPEVVATAPPTMLATEPPPLRSLPRRGQITYTLVYGDQKFNIGRTVQTWQIDGDRYRLGSASETTGIVEVFRSERRTFMSKGRVTSSGLRPDTFLMSRIRRGEIDEARAQFDWDAGQLTWGSVNEKEHAQLLAGSQDFLSLMYQLSIQPPSPGRLRVPITTGTKFETYELDVLPEETIETPLGALRALPVKQVAKPGAETIQIWLAAEYRYLPVKLRFYNRAGEPTGEQIVSDIRVSNETGESTSSR